MSASWRGQISTLLIYVHHSSFSLHSSPSLSGTAWLRMAPNGPTDHMGSLSAFVVVFRAATVLSFTSLHHIGGSSADCSSTDVQYRPSSLSPTRSHSRVLIRLAHTVRRSRGRGFAASSVCSRSTIRVARPSLGHVVRPLIQRIKLSSLTMLAIVGTESWAL